MAGRIALQGSISKTKKTVDVLTETRSINFRSNIKILWRYLVLLNFQIPCDLIYVAGSPDDNQNLEGETYTAGLCQV